MGDILARALGIKAINSKPGNSVFIAAYNATKEMQDKADFVCDGVSDEQDIIDAINLLPSGGNITLSEGSFIFESNIDTSIITNCPNKIIIQGMGTSTVIKPGSDYIAHQHVFNLSNVSDWTLKSFSIDGSDMIDNIGGFFILVYCSTRIELTNLKLHASPSSCIYLMPGSIDILIHDCQIYDIFNSGIILSGDGGTIEKVTITNNIIKNCGLSLESNNDKMGIQLEGQYDQTISEVIISDNIIVENNKNGIWSSILRESIIANNVISDNGGNGILLLDAERIIIGNNIITGNALNAIPGYRHGLRISDRGLTDNSKNIIISNNLFDEHVEAHVKIFGNSQDISIIGNAFVGTPWLPISITTNSPGTGNFKISENIGFENKKRGIAIIPEGSTYIDVTHGLTAHDDGVDIIAKVIPTNDLGNSTRFWVDNIGSTTFRVNVDSDPGVTTATFMWEANCRWG